MTQTKQELPPYSPLALISPSLVARTLFTLSRTALFVLTARRTASRTLGGARLLLLFLVFLVLLSTPATSAVGVRVGSVSAAIGWQIRGNQHTLKVLGRIIRQGAHSAFQKVFVRWNCTERKNRKDSNGIKM